MKKYADGDKTSCQIEKQVLIDELKQRQAAYYEEAERLRHNGELGATMPWLNKASAIDWAVIKISDMECNDVVKFAAEHDIDLPEEVRKRYGGAGGEIKARLMNTGFGQLFSNITAAAHIAQNIKSVTNNMVNKLNNYINNLTNFSVDFEQNPDGSMTIPWYVDQQKGEMHLPQIINGEQLEEDLRLPIIKDYESEVYEFYLWVLENDGKQALCRYVNSFLQQEIEDIPENGIAMQIYLAQMNAFGYLENWEEISTSCLDEHGNYK